MPKRRANGEGNIRKRKDGRWEGRYTVGHDPETGKAIIKNVLGKTQAEIKEKLKKAIEENVGIDYGRAKTYTVGSWLEVWMALFRWHISPLWTCNGSTSTCWTAAGLTVLKPRKSREDWHPRRYATSTR